MKSGPRFRSPPLKFPMHGVQSGLATATAQHHAEPEDAEKTCGWFWDQQTQFLGSRLTTTPNLFDFCFAQSTIPLGNVIDTAPPLAVLSASVWIGTDMKV